MSLRYTLRYTICDGDKSTAGGTVIAHRADKLDGRAIAYEGDPVVCPACGTTGYIGCVGERVFSKGVNGRQEALSYDRCVCNCDPRPLLFASQRRSGVCA
ncbi:PAAR domain-containing protein [Paraburkholderia ginsengisoli]|uniref:PAAR domain-containing protein n=1 Tax=Paraburkholderia ginsengisoli TaxID=311231 RepID=A0A7T4N8T0_9BURK|nr:PAAR domain-containing protein [Paraburkholderia ginsengisoli]QQC67349.1 PAAR domain-containing protein [Paraburkholderia ginsengisoli]